MQTINGILHPTKQCRDCVATILVSDPDLCERCERCDMEELEGFGAHLHKHQASGPGIDVTLFPSEWEIVVKALNPTGVSFQYREDMEQLHRSVKRQVKFRRENG